ncbi:MAG: glycosyltransferase family 2 protein [Flavobacteriaceae bacterium]|nr:glycosyltransferase family 2 protein [Flavobacteriaceae bacterium]
MNKDQPLVSIIIPTHNRAHLIGETLDSVLAQTYPHWECIIVDDGSTDHTNEVVGAYVQKDARFRYYQRPESHKPGGNGARNYGFEVSKGDYVNWFDDDDVMLEDFLKTKVEAISPNVGFIICSGYYVNEKLENSVPIDLKVDTFLFKDYVLWKLQILTPSVLFKKTFLTNKELFSTEIYRGQETELFSRLFYQMKADKYLIVNKPLFLYRQHKMTKTEKHKTYISSYCKSQCIIAKANLDRSIYIDDQDLKEYYYKGLVNNFYLSLSKKDTKIATYILNKILRKIKSLNFVNHLEFTVLGNVFVIIKRGSYRFEKRWKLFKI